MTSDSTSSRLPLLLSACSCPAGGGIIQAQKVLHAVVAAAGGTSGMIPLISSHLILVSLASFPAKPYLASQGRASSSSSHPLSPLPRCHRNPSFRMNCRIVIPHPYPALLSPAQVWKSALRWIRTVLSPDLAARSPRIDGVQHTCAHRVTCQSITRRPWPPCLSAWTADWRRF